MKNKNTHEMNELGLIGTHELNEHMFITRQHGPSTPLMETRAILCF